MYSTTHSKDVFDDMEPLALQSLLPPPESLYDSASESPAPVDPHNMGPRPRPNPQFTFSALANRRRSPLSSPELSIPRRSSKTPRNHEIDRPINVGEEMRLAVVIQMPTDEAERRSHDDEDEEVAWEDGMELGVWEGVVDYGRPMRYGDIYRYG